VSAVEIETRGDVPAHESRPAPGGDVALAPPGVNEFPSPEGPLSKDGLAAGLALPADPEVIAYTDTLQRGDWLELRSIGIGGSDAAAAAGLSPWKSPLALYLEKSGEIEPEDFSTERMVWGQRLEAAICDGFSEDVGVPVFAAPVMLRSRAHPFMQANVDRFAGAPDNVTGVVEAKNSSHKDIWEEGVPVHYELQVQHYLAVTGLPVFWLAVLLFGNQLRWWRIERDDLVIADLLAIESDFWQRVVDHRPPAADGQSSTTDALKRLRAHEGAKVQLPEEARTLLRELTFAKQSAKTAAEREQELENELKALLGPAEIGLLGDKEAATWKQAHRASLDTKAIEADLPRLTIPLLGLVGEIDPLAPYRRRKPYRTLRLAKEFK
jgi:putative phage-type endonuclease